MFAGICAAAAAYGAYKGSALWPWFAGGGSFFLLTGLFAEPVLRPVHAAWMKFAHALGWLNTRLLLGVFFYLVLTPVALVLRLAGKDLLQQRLDRSARTYWIKREPAQFDPDRYERLF
jgi:hypothetical protein